MDFRLGAVSPAYRAIESHTIWRLRRWLCRKYKVRSGKHVRFSNERLYEEYGLTRLEPKTQTPSVGEGMSPTESRMRENRTSGSTSRGWKRGQGSRTEDRIERNGVPRLAGLYHRALKLARQSLTLRFPTCKG